MITLLVSYLITIKFYYKIIYVKESYFFFSGKRTKSFSKRLSKGKDNCRGVCLFLKYVVLKEWKKLPKSLLRVTFFTSGLFFSSFKKGYISKIFVKEITSFLNVVFISIRQRYILKSVLLIASKSILAGNFS